MFLSRLLLDTRRNQARAWLSDTQALHRFIMSAFPQAVSPAARAELGVLFRIEPMREPPAIPILVQSLLEPDWPDSVNVSKADPARPIQPLLESIRAGLVYRFALHANATRKVDTKSGPDGVRRNGRRVELRGEEAKSAWLRRRGELAGFELLALENDSGLADVSISPAERRQGRKRAVNEPASVLTITGTRFEGRLCVTDPDRFRAALATGIGPGKAYGCGLLSIAPWRPYDDQGPTQSSQSTR